MDPGRVPIHSSSPAVERGMNVTPIRRYAGSSYTTSWPNPRSTSASRRTAARTRSSSFAGARLNGILSESAIFNRPGSRRAAIAYGSAGGGGRCRSPGWLPLSTSSISAPSATVRVSGPRHVRPLNASASGHVEIRPRWGLIPTRPVHAAGIRTDPAPSEPTAALTSPAATAAAAPPEDPPGV